FCAAPPTASLHPLSLHDALPIFGPVPPVPRPPGHDDLDPAGGARMRIHVIGCCGSFAGPRGAASSYLIEHEDEAGHTWRLLMDLDRKSTRLNSSHVSISYAVFCL